MKKTKKNEPIKKPIQTPTQTAPIPIEATLPETNEERVARVNRANSKIREVLKEYNCILMVPTLDISSGRIFPSIQVVAQQLK